MNTETAQITGPEWLNEARHTAQSLLKQQDNITINDVVLVTPLPGHLHPNIKGSVFHHPVFNKVNIERSRTNVSHGHFVHRWTLAAEYYPKSLMEYRRRNVEDYGA